ncbi:MAG: MerR family transcriptional regulator [Enterocloster asparagiformis]|nr:MerR family transcriptional regulator [Enterocloster asparagiformis]
MKELFTIGEMAELFQINIRTLRYYDDIGLLKPESVNPDTGYRYYSTKQFERLNTIKYLRTLNMPLEKMKQFFQNRDARVMEQILEDQLIATRDQLEQLRNMERKLNRRLEQLRYAMNAPMEEIRPVSFPPRPVAFLRRQISQEESLEYPLRELERMNDLKPVMFLGKVGVTVGMEDLRQGLPTRFSGIFVFLEEEDNYRGSARMLPGGDYLTILYSGTHQESAAYYRRLFAAMEERGLSPAGDSVEITWIDSGFTQDLSQYVTELQIPVRSG